MLLKFPVTTEPVEPKPPLERICIKEKFINGGAENDRTVIIYRYDMYLKFSRN
jgi:hypothetical protein